MVHAWKARASVAALVVVGLLGPASVGRADEAARAGEASAALDPTAIGEAIGKLDVEVKRWGGTAGVLVIDAGSGARVAGLNEHQAFNPASNGKLPTAAAALRLLGPQHRFVTGLYGTIVGDGVDQLVLRGVTNGQRVPEDWEAANAHQLVQQSMRAPAKSAFDPKAMELNFFFTPGGSSEGGHYA